MPASNTRPIIFSSPMVRAILDGRKTMTRRVAKIEGYDGTRAYRFYMPGLKLEPYTIHCPFGQPGERMIDAQLAGDRLWVRETWKELTNGVVFRADVGKMIFAVGGNYTIADKGPWRPSIFMPRWASRITLEITAVRVERVQDISRADAILEGFPMPTQSDGMHPWPEDQFRKLWDALNAKRDYGWDADPWVWVISFKRVE